MAFFNLFTRPSPATIEDKLRAQYVPMFLGMGMSSREAERAFADRFRQVKEDHAREGADSEPRDYGGVLLSRESSDEATRSALDRKRAEGVRDADIRWWWNLHYFERQMMIRDDEANRMAGFLGLLRQGLPPEQAADRVRKFHVCYGDPADSSQGTGEDRALPIELKDRINTYMERRSRADPERFRLELLSMSSINALLHAELRRGQI
jgi:hypothetical protein